MSRFLVLLAVVAIVGLVGVFVPVNGVTLAERWGIQPPGAAPVAARSAPAPAAAPAPAVPDENHTQADREALDRIVSRHAGGSSARP